MQLSVPQKHLGPRSFFVCALSINLLLILSIDMYVPALPSMQRAFDVSAAYLNLTVFVFFAFCAVGVVLAGPVSDRFGRRPVLVAGCGLFAASSILCALAPNVEFLVAFRIGQALGYGAVSTIETAMIKDAYAGPDLKLAMTCLQSLIIIGPALAPFLGTFVLSLAGWRGIFEFLAVCGVIGFLLSLLISETHLRGDAPTPGVADSLRDMLRGVRALGGDRSFMALALLMGVAGMPYFAFIAVVSYVLMDFFAVSYFTYSCIYAAACVVTIAAPYVYVWLSKSMKVRGILKLCVGLTALSFALMAAFGTASPVLFLVAFVPYALAEGIVRPMAFVVLLDQPDDRVGAASSFSNFSYSILTSVATVLATLPWTNFVVGIVVLTGGAAVIMAVLYAWGCARRRERRGRRRAASGRAAKAGCAREPGRQGTRRRRSRPAGAASSLGSAESGTQGDAAPCLVLEEGVLELVLVLDGQRGLQHVAAERADGVDELVGGHLVHHHEHGAVVGGQQVAHAVLEVLVHAVLHDGARQRADAGTDGRAEHGHEEQQAEQDAPEQAPHRGGAHLGTGRDHVVLAVGMARHHGDGLQADDEVLVEVEDLLVGGLRLFFARITEHDEGAHGQAPIN